LELGVEVHLGAVVTGIYPQKNVGVVENEQLAFYAANAIIVATGASENMIPFDGWTLPGVVGAGAAQTMINLHGVQIGQKVLMVGSGNVGLVVSYQLLQAGIQVVAVIDAASRIGGYGVHAAKIARTGIPFYLSHTITKAAGRGHVETAAIAQVDERFRPIEGTAKTFDVDTVCIAVGLSPMSQLLKMAGCRMQPGGLTPECDPYGKTSIAGIFAAGDVAGIEEASAAIIGGSIVGAAVAMTSGYLDESRFAEKYKQFNTSLASLRQGMFAKENRGRRELVETDEGIPLSRSLLTKGYLDEAEIGRFPGVINKKGVHPVIECTQNIPCNPCQSVCRFGCIRVGDHITALPSSDLLADCVNCGMCVASCPGQAIFLVDEDNSTVTIPYEFLPLPSIGDKGVALDRSGQVICEAEIVGVKKTQAYDATTLLTLRTPREKLNAARFFQVKEASNK
jgi:thioredoxin reductase/Fe-S-cluster-containing hydrogenase component 2